MEPVGPPVGRFGAVATGGTVASMSAAARPDRTQLALEIFRGERTITPVLAAASAVLALTTDVDGHGWLSVLVVGAVAPFVVWAWRPSVGVLPVVASSVAVVVIVTRGGDYEPATFYLSVAAVIVGSFEDSRARFLIEGVVLVGTPGFIWLVFFSDYFAALWTLGIALPLLLTRAGRKQQLLAYDLAEAKAALADQRVAEERRRIARDVHDSVGHGLAAMLLHLTAARHVLRRDVDDADESLAEAEAVGKRAIVELRETLGLLRSASDADDTPCQPAPDATHLAELGVEIVGDVARLDARVGRSLHRVAAEAFANARRHAPAAATTACLDVGDERAVLTVVSRGPLQPQPGDDAARPRYGIVGMSERLAAVGGALDVGPTDDGWLVRATVPVSRS